MSAATFISPLEPGKSIVSWRGNTPRHWKIQRLKWSVSGIYNGIWGSDPDGENDLICIRVADFDRNRKVVVDTPPTIRSIDPSQRNNRLLEAGDLLIEKSGGGDNQLVGCVVYFDQSIEAVCSNFVARMPPSEGMNSRFLTYLHSSLYSERLNFPSIKQTTGIQNLDADSYLSIHAPFPPESEQDVIADYLDRETTQIDTLIAEKERMLALLEAKRAALISRAVTRGLNPEVPTKPSGLDWLGDIPEHWEVMRAKGLFREVDERTTTGEEELLSLRMNVGLVPHHEVSEKELEPKDVIGFKRVMAGQLVINRMRASMGLIAISPSDGLVSPDYAVFDIVHPIHIPYFLALFNTGLVGALFRSSSKGIGTGSQGFLRLYTESFLSIHFPVPPIEEQKEIVGTLDTEKEETGILEAALRESIVLLKERRSALITAAVTGKIPVEEMNV